MHFSTFLAMGALATAAPFNIEAVEDSKLGEFEITNFSFGCTTTCDWSFDVSVSGNFTNHPGFSTPVKCSGSTKTQTFEYSSCKGVDGKPNQSVQAYIKEKDDDNVLRLQYSVEQPKVGAHYWYNGHDSVNSMTGTGHQATNFTVKESKAFATQ